MNYLSYFRYGLTVGLLGCVIGVASTGARGAPPAVAPNIPHVDRNGYNEVLTGKWRLTSPVAVVSGGGPSAATLANLPAGTQLRALKVEILTLRPAICEALRDGVLNIRQWIRSGNTLNSEREQNVPFRRGDRVYELDYYGEGECSVWFKGVTGVAECGMNALTGGAELCRYVGANKPVSEVWAYVETTSGLRGWVRNPKAKGMSRHD